MEERTACKRRGARHRALHRAIGALVATVTVVAAASGAVSAAAPDDDPSLFERQYLTGNWRGTRSTLEEYGFKPYLTYTGMVWANLAGGNKRGVEARGYLDFGVDVDLAKLGTWKGFGAHIDFHWWQGGDPTRDLIGGLLAMALDEWEAASTFRVYNIYLRQALDDDRWVFKIGQIAADSDFMISQYAGMFINAAFGDLPTQNLNLGAPVYPLAAPGVYASGRPWPWLVGRFGAYTGDAGEDTAGNHGFEWELGNRAGYTFFYELGLVLPEQAPYGTYTFGAIYNTGSAAQFGDSTERSDHYELYGVVDQPVLLNADGTPRVGIFTHLSGTPQDPETIADFYADVGLVWFGPLPPRPNDSVGIAFSAVHFADDFRDDIHNSLGAGERLIEVTYQIAVTPWLIVQPDFQWFFHPVESGRDAQSLGLEAVALF